MSFDNHTATAQDQTKQGSAWASPVPDEVKSAVLTAIDNGATVTEIAEKFAISTTTVYNIVRNDGALEARVKRIMKRIADLEQMLGL